MDKSRQQNQLKREFNSRTLGMMTLSSSIGTGLFLASGQVIHTAGPAGAMLAYVVAGICSYFLMTLLCELSSYMPSTGSFYVYAEKFVDSAFGYALAWNYWYSLAINITLEIVAAALIMQYWYPATPVYIWFLLFMFTIVLLNIVSTRFYAEAEFWISMIKVATIVLFILIGAGMVLGFNHEPAAGLDNWRRAGSPLQNGWLPFLSVMVVAGFTFQGIEMLAIATGECINPGKIIPKTINMVFWRILIFYLLTLFIISLIIPFDSPRLASATTAYSPFTLVFKKAGIPYAASLINAVILTAIISSANMNMYSATRLLWYFGKRNLAPSRVASVNKRGIPMAALLAATVVALGAFVATMLVDGHIYLWLLNVISLSGFISWIGIAVCHYRFRKIYAAQGGSLQQLPYASRFHPYAAIFVILSCMAIVYGYFIDLTVNNNASVFDIILSSSSIIIFAALWLGYKYKHKTKVVRVDGLVQSSYASSLET